MNSAYDFPVMRVLRRQLGLTLQEVARRSGLTYPTVESVETNKTLPSRKTLDALPGRCRFRPGLRRCRPGAERLHPARWDVKSFLPGAAKLAFSGRLGRVG